MMKLKTNLGVALILVALSGGAVAQACEDTELYRYMETMADNLRTISGAVRSNDLESAQSHMPDMLAAARQAQQQTPYSLRDGSSADVSAFQRAVGDLVALVEDLDDALRQGDSRAAASTLREIGEARRSGHRRFQARSC